jgi:hypothetical protein
LFKELIYSARVVLGTDIAGRTLHVWPDDVFLVSYPKCGSTWTRFLVANLIHPDKAVSFANIERVIPDIHGQSRKALRRLPRPRILKSHECFDPRYQRLVYLVRDPRDVAVSSYHHDRRERKVENNFPIERFVEERFLRSDEYFGTWGDHTRSWLMTAKNFAVSTRLKAGFAGNPGTWGENVTSWLAARGDSRDFLLLRYEDMLEDTVGALAKIASFLRFNPTHSDLERAVELSSADHMRVLEVRERHLWKTTKGSRTDIPFVRKAKAQQWSDELPSSSLAAIEAAWGPVMEILGYALVMQKSESGSARAAGAGAASGSVGFTTPA